MNIDKIKEYLSSNLSRYRYEHSLSVADVSRKLANVYGESAEDAYIAGLLHDIAKEYDDELNRELVKKYSLDSSLLDSSNRGIVHAFVGAEVSRELFKVNDRVYKSIKYHNLGSVDMGLLEKIVFVADKIEPNKDYVGIEEEREMAFRDIDKAFIMCLVNRKKKQESIGKTFNKASQEVLDYFLETLE